MTSVALIEPLLPPWPDKAPSGDATFDSGSRYQKGRTLLEDLLEVVPEGYTTPEGTTTDGIAHRDHQATEPGRC